MSEQIKDTKSRPTIDDLAYGINDLKAARDKEIAHVRIVFAEAVKCRKERLKEGYYFVYRGFHGYHFGMGRYSEAWSFPVLSAWKPRSAGMYFYSDPKSKANLNADIDAYCMAHGLAIPPDEAWLIDEVPA